MAIITVVSATDRNTVQTRISCGYPAVKTPIHASIRHYIHGVRAVCHIIGTGLVSRRKRNPFSLATRQQPTDQDRIHRRDWYMRRYFMAASAYSRHLWGSEFPPPPNLQFPPAAAKLCSLNLFFRPGVDNGLQICHGNFLLMDNKISTGNCSSLSNQKGANLCLNAPNTFGDPLRELMWRFTFFAMTCQKFVKSR